MRNTRNITKTALFTAVLCVSSLLSIPLPSGMPLTLQTFAVALAGFVLGWREAAASVGVYLTLGAVGLPVFSGFSSGFARLFGLTGGYLWGFLFLAAACGAVPRTKRLLSIGTALLGLALCHLLGTAQFALVSGASPAAAFLMASAPYMIKDVLSVLGAFLLAAVLEKSLRRA
ncbi:MAG: biotin transporter BioY [Ruminococcus sp.]|nr:biotin transporter BioY [Ruminococcus sp.]